MLETIITIILIPFALGAVIITGAMVAGVVQYFTGRNRAKN